MNNHYDFRTNISTGIIELVWVDVEEQREAVLCEIGAQGFDPDGASEYMESDDWMKETTFDARGYFSNTEIDVSELVEYAHSHGLIQFDLRRELENMGFSDMGGSTRAKMFECEGAQIWVEPEMLVLVSTKTSAIGINLDVPNTYADFQPIRDKILELIETPTH